MLNGHLSIFHALVNTLWPFAIEKIDREVAGAPAWKGRHIVGIGTDILTIWEWVELFVLVESLVLITITLRQELVAAGRSEL